MNADEALETITRHARGDIRKLFKNNRLLPISEWPEDVADCVKAIKPTRFGTAIVFYDKPKACELMAIAVGKLQQKFDRAHKLTICSALARSRPSATMNDGAEQSVRGQPQETRLRGAADASCSSDATHALLELVTDITEAARKIEAIVT